MLNINLQNVDQDHFSLASGRPQDCVMSRRVSVGVTNTLQYMARWENEAPQMQDNVIYLVVTTESHSTFRQK